MFTEWLQKSQNRKGMQFMNSMHSITAYLSHCSIIYLTEIVTDRNIHYTQTVSVKIERCKRERSSYCLPSTSPSSSSLLVSLRNRRWKWTGSDAKTYHQQQCWRKGEGCAAWRGMRGGGCSLTMVTNKMGISHSQICLISYFSPSSLTVSVSVLTAEIFLFLTVFFLSPHRLSRTFRCLNICTLVSFSMV